jgi:hypothetical protein
MNSIEEKKNESDFMNKFSVEFSKNQQDCKIRI